MGLLSEPIHGNECTADFHKPITVEALRRFDSDLRLLWNRRVQTFQVYRLTGRSDKWIEPRLVWICDWTEGVLGADNPTALLKYLRDADCGPNGEEIDRVEQRHDFQRIEEEEKRRRFIDDEWKHATAENRRQLQRAWAPFRDRTPFVR